MLTNNAAKRKGFIVAIVEGIKAETVVSVLHRLPEKARKKVKKNTLDVALRLSNMRIRHRRAALDAENEAIEQFCKNGILF